MHKPYLMQRLLQRGQSAVHKGVDCLFSYDYMGSAEFEFGALRRSLGELRGQSNHVLRSVKAGDKKWWFFGTPELWDAAQAWVDNQLLKPTRQYCQMKEPSYLVETYQGNTEYIGWWCLDEGAAFLILTKRKTAEKFAKALGVKAS